MLKQEQLTLFSDINWNRSFFTKISVTELKLSRKLKLSYYSDFKIVSPQLFLGYFPKWRSEEILECRSEGDLIA